jgi:hypothetical protein
MLHSCAANISGAGNGEQRLSRDGRSVDVWPGQEPEGACLTVMRGIVPANVAKMLILV